MPLKAGKTSFMEIEGRLTDMTPLQEFSESFPYPLGELIDPVGQSYMRFTWRSERRGEAG